MLHQKTSCCAQGVSHKPSNQDSHLPKALSGTTSIWADFSSSNCAVRKKGTQMTAIRLFMFYRRGGLPIGAAAKKAIKAAYRGLM
jgi:hypothetical protein